MKENKKYHYTYKITNLVNNKIYYGKHSTNDLNDGYFSSGGMVLQYAIKKYGSKNFKLEIDKNFDSEGEALKYERKIVDEKFVDSKDTYNSTLGGGNGLKKLRIPSKSKKVKILKMSVTCHDKLKKYAKWKDRTMKRILEDFVDDLPEIKKHGVKLKTNGEIIKF